MSSSALAASVRQLCGRLAEQRVHNETDDHLIRAFTANRDDSAFAALVRRHGPMVLHVCRRVLGHEQDAEDAFQATFLVLARNAASLRKKTSLTSWLHGTAYRTAMKAKQSAARRRKHEAQAPTRTPADPPDELRWREVRLLLDEEIAALPEIYRSVFILCSLESVSREEAARRLGVKEGTVSSRLTAARKRLQKQLVRRGVDLTAVLAAAALATPSALPAGLMAKTVEAALATATSEGMASVVSASVVELVEGAMMVSKTKIATVVLLTATMLAGASVAAYRGLAANALMPSAQPAESPAAKADAKPKAAPPKREAAKTVEIKGRVLGPDGKPKAGAKLLVLAQGSEAKQVGVSAADGRFTVAVPKEAKNGYLVAQTDDTGIDFYNLFPLKAQKQIELRLVMDHVIRGRIVNTEGKPVAGVRVSAGEIATYLNNSLDSFMAAWMNLFVARGKGLATQKQLWSGADALFTATTDADGRFNLHGIGAERTVRLHFRGGGIADTAAWVVNRAGFDPKPYNRANMDRGREGRRSVNWRWWILSGPDFSVVAEAEKVIRGVVKDADTGDVRPGLEVLLTSYKDEPLQDTPKAKTDAQGYYEIHGARKAKSYLIVVPCDPVTATMTSQVWADDTPDYRPVTANLKVKKGVIVTGKVIDRTTGESLPGFVMAAVLRGNPFVKDYPKFAPLFMAQYDSYGSTDAGGTFRVVTIPGPVLLMGKGEISSRIPYKWQGADPNYPQYFTKDGGGFYGHNIMAPLQGHCKVLEIKPGVAEVKQDIVLERQRVLAVVNIQDAEGRPLSGVWGVTGGDKFWIPYDLMESDSCSVYGKPSDKPQLVVFYHPDKKLAGTMTLKGNEKRPIVVKLGPAGRIKGRLLDDVGKPLGGITLDLRYREDAAKEIHDRVHEGKEIVSDANGAFAFDDVISGCKWEMTFRRGQRRFERAKKSTEATMQLKPGECRDLGAIKLKQITEKPGE
jgi:RNA polymerase sigma factor (sigma-70 family)